MKKINKKYAEILLFSIKIITFAQSFEKQQVFCAIQLLLNNVNYRKFVAERLRYINYINKELLTLI